MFEEGGETELVLWGGHGCYIWPLGTQTRGMRSKMAGLY